MGSWLLVSLRAIGLNPSPTDHSPTLLKAHISSNIESPDVERSSNLLTAVWAQPLCPCVHCRHPSREAGGGGKLSVWKCSGKLSRKKTNSLIHYLMQSCLAFLFIFPLSFFAFVFYSTQLYLPSALCFSNFSLVLLAKKNLRKNLIPLHFPNFSQMSS